MPWYILPTLFVGLVGPIALTLLVWRSGWLDGGRALGLGTSAWVLWWTGYFLMGGAVEWARTGEVGLLVSTALALLGGLAGLATSLLKAAAWTRRLLYVMAGLLTLMMMYVSLLSAILFFVTPVVVAIFLALALTLKRDEQGRRSLATSFILQ